MKHISISYAKYSFFGLSSFLLDVLLIWIFVEIANTTYIPAVAIAFIISSLYHYFLIRIFVFHKCKRRFIAGATYFFLFAGLGLVAVTVMTIIAVEVFSMHYLVARILVGVIEGLWNFTTNYFFNFKAHLLHKTCGPQRNEAENLETFDERKDNQKVY